VPSEIKQNNQKIALLPRARLDIFDKSLSFLSLSEQEKTHLQYLLDKSALEEKLSIFYSEKGVALQTIVATSITTIDNGKKLYQSLQEKNEQVPDVVVFVSKNAGVLAKLMLPKIFITQASLFAVGKSCQGFFSEQNIQVACANEESAQGLLSLSEFSELQGKNILICKGAKGLNDLQEQCELRGANVEVIDFYQREGIPQITLPNANNISEIYAVSVFALKHLLEGISQDQADHLKKIPLSAMSERIASAASQMGFVDVSLRVL
jgi:uroporphyrinogen-III synthase